MLHLLVLRRDRVTENSFDLGENDDTYADGFYDPQWSAFDNLNILGSPSGGPGAIGPNEMLNSYSKYVSGTFLTFFNFISYSFGRGGLIENDNFSLEIESGSIRPPPIFQCKLQNSQKLDSL